MINLAFNHIEGRCHWILWNRGAIYLNLLFKDTLAAVSNVDQQGPWEGAGRAVKRKLYNNIDGMCWGFRASWQ